jgi:hypothetical protein
MSIEPMAPEARTIFSKWGEAARGGFQAVPDVLFKNQNELGISATDMVVLLNILMHWWYRELKPYPRVTTIARRMGSTVRTVQRSIQTLEEKGLLTRKRREGDGLPTLDPAPLVEKLQELVKKDPDYMARVGRLVA